MPKVLLVALPILVMAAAVAALAWRGRWPSRHAINVVSSVLLLAYVVTTAGLGIFWVANQQLPVFDWHYLFGYGTVLLVALHLAFNFRVVWRFFTGPPRASPPATAEAVGRRGALSAMGLLAATGAAFALGLRHGRSELRIEAGAGAGAAQADDANAMTQIERFHAYSSHGRTGVMRRAPGVDWGDPPPAFKHYPGVARVALPDPRRRGSPVLDLAALGRALWHTSGITGRRGGLALRASPASGALFSTELYVAAREVSGLSPGLWHYDPEAHALERLSAVPPDDAVLGALGEMALRDVPAMVLATAMFRRTGHKYRDRTYRYVLADLGHALENLRAASVALALRATLLPAFDESRAAAALGVDEGEEGVLAMVALHREGPKETRPMPARFAMRRWHPAPLVAEDASVLGVTAAVHRTTSLRVLPGPPPRTVQSLPSPFDAIVLAPAPSQQKDVLSLIAARRSVRRFARSELPLESLAGVLQAMTSSTGPLLSPAVRVDVVVHAVAGLAPGAYRYEPAQRALLPRRVPASLRAAARAAALDQDVIGDAAAVFVLSADRAALSTEMHGAARGYRHAFIETGLMGERIYLEAGARGLGACAVGAFYDDEASALVGADPAREWVLHFAALGVPAR